LDKFEYNIKVEKMKKLVGKKNFETAAEIADSIDWQKIKNTRMLSIVSMVYERNRRFKDAKDILMLAYDQSPGGRRQLYKLTELSAKEHNFKDAAMFYKEYAEMAPDDMSLYTLKYRILSEQEAPLEEQIQVLEAYKEREFDEQWGYELAKLYHKAGRKDECVRLCDEIILWFSVGSYVERAAKLKALYEPLTPDQEEKVLHRDKYEAYVRQAAQECEIQVEKNIEEAVALRQAVEAARAAAEGEPGRRAEPELITASAPGIEDEAEAGTEPASMAMREREGEIEGEPATAKILKIQEARKAEAEFAATVASEREGGAEAGTQSGEEAEAEDAAGEIAPGEKEDTDGAAPQEQGSSKIIELRERDAAETAALPEEESSEEDTLPEKEDTAGEKEEYLAGKEHMACRGETEAGLDGEKEMVEGTQSFGEEELGTQEESLEEKMMNDRWEDGVEHILSMFNKEQEEPDEEKPWEKQGQEAMVPGLLYVSVSSVQEGMGYATDAIRELHRMRGEKTKKVAKITGRKLNYLGMEDSLKKLKGADLIVQEANSLSDRCLAEILWLTQKMPLQMIIVLMDTEEQIGLLDARAEELMVDVLCRIEQEERAKRAARKVQIRPVMMPDMAKVEAKIELSEQEMEAAATTDRQEEGESDLMDLDIQIPADLGVDSVARPKAIDQEQLQANLVSMAEAMVQEEAVSGQPGIRNYQAQHYQDTKEYQDIPYQEGQNYQDGRNHQIPQGYRDMPTHQESQDYQDMRGYQESQGYHEMQAHRDGPNTGHRETENMGRELSVPDFVAKIKDYADELDCAVEDMAGLAIYALADKYIEDGIMLTPKLAKDVTEAAVIRADRKGLGGLFASKYDKEGRLILKESHFKMRAR